MKQPLTGTENKIYLYLKGKKKVLLADIAESIDSTEDSVKTHMYRMRKKGVKFKRKREGSNGPYKYTLDEKEEEDEVRYISGDDPGKKIYEGLLGVNEAVLDGTLTQTADYEFERSIAIIGLGDIHAGDPHNNLKMIHDICHNIIPNTKDLYVLLGGDLFDNSNTDNSPQGAFSTLDIENEAKLLQYLLEPTKDKILASCGGNHERRTLRNAGFRIEKYLLGDLTGPFGPHGIFLELTVGGHLTTIYMRHKMDGHSQYNPLHPNTRAILFREAGNADVVWRYHTHESAIGNYSINGKERWLIVSGTSVVYSEYADSLACSPSVSSFPILILTKDGERLAFRRLSEGLKFFKMLKENET